MARTSGRPFASCAIAIAILCLAGLPASAAFVEWDMPAGQNFTGFRVYIGTTNRAYNQSFDVGMRTNLFLTNLNAATTYFLAATTYDTNGVESDLSDEIIYTPPVNGTNALAVPFRIALSTNVFLQFPAVAGQQYWIVASFDLQIWTQVYAITAAGTGTLGYSEPFFSNYPMKFYRVLATP
jgi:hypothetical protein